MREKRKVRILIFSLLCYYDIGGDDALQPTSNDRIHDTSDSKRYNVSNVVDIIVHFIPVPYPFISARWQSHLSAKKDTFYTSKWAPEYPLLCLKHKLFIIKIWQGEIWLTPTLITHKNYKHLNKIYRIYWIFIWHWSRKNYSIITLGDFMKLLDEFTEFKIELA